jgi:hypothetical protein
MTNEEYAAIKSLREKGYAVCVFSPEELRGADQDDVEQGLVVAGWDVIDAHAKFPDPAYE